MSDDRYSRLSERRERYAEPRLSDTIDLAIRRLTAAIVIAGGLVGVGLYSSGDEPARYEVTTTADGRIIRLNRDSGTVIGCREQNCTILLQSGQRLEDPLADEDEKAAEEDSNAAASNETGALEQPETLALPAPAAANENGAAAEQP